MASLRDPISLLELPQEIRCMIWDRVIGQHPIQVLLSTSVSNTGAQSDGTTSTRYNTRLQTKRLEGQNRKDPLDSRRVICRLLDQEDHFPFQHEDRAYLSDPLDLRFLQTCKLIYMDARYRPFTHRVFHICDPVAFNYWSRSLNKTQLAFVRSLEIDILAHAIFECHDNPADHGLGKLLFQASSSSQLRGDPWRFEFSHPTLLMSLLPSVSHIQVNLCLKCSQPNPAQPFKCALPLASAALDHDTTMSESQANHLAFLLDTKGLKRIPIGFRSLRSFNLKIIPDPTCYAHQKLSRLEAPLDQVLETGLHEDCPVWPVEDLESNRDNPYLYEPVTWEWLSSAVRRWMYQEKEKIISNQD